MGENTPERLKSFRSQYSAEGRPPKGLAVAQLAVLVAGFGALLALHLVGPAAKESPSAGAPVEGGLSEETLRGLAGYLADKKQFGAAIEAYEAYLDKAALDPAARARICYSVARLAIDAEQFEKALAHLYQAELLDPGSDLKDEIDKKVALCLDKLGRSVDLRRELRKRTAIRRTADDLEPGEVVLAAFAGEVITDRALALEIEKLPPTVRESFTTPEKKIDLLRNMVAERLLLDKALRLELDKDPAIQEALRSQLDAMVVRKLIDDEVREKIVVTPEDVERFYKAERERFTRPATAQVLVGKSDTAEAAENLDSFPDPPVTVLQGGVIPGVGANEEVIEAVFAAEPGGEVGPYLIQGTWYKFKVTAKSPENALLFDEVKDRAARMLRFQKEQEEVTRLIEETLSARDVRLYPERLMGATSP